MWLALDTSGEISTVAVADGETTIAELTVRRKKTHSEQLIYHIDTALALAGTEREALTGIAVTVGPGSFTGLRIGLATAKALAFTLNIPVVGVDTLAVLLANIQAPKVSVCALLDAQKGNVYSALGTWQKDRLSIVEEEHVAPFGDVLARLQERTEPVVCVGEGAALFAAEIEQAPAHVSLAPQALRYVRAGLVAQAGQRKFARCGGDDLFSLAPNYIRRSEAEVLWEARQCKE